MTITTAMDCSINAGLSSQYVDIVTQYLPLLLVPLMSYLIIVYVHPTLSLHFKHHLQKTDSTAVYRTEFQNIIKRDADEEEEAKVKFAKRWKIFQLECLLIANYNIYLVLMWSYPFTQLAHEKTKDFQSIVDHYIPYIHSTLSLAVMVLFFTIVFSGLYFKWRKFSFISALSISTSINIICMVSYWLPKMLMSFACDPVHTFVVIIIMISVYPLVSYLYILAIFCKLALRQACFTRYPCTKKSLIYFLASVTLILSCYCVSVIMSIDMFVIPQNNDGLWYLEIFVILIGLLEVCLFRIVHYYAYKHALVRSRMLMLHVFNDMTWAEVHEEKNGIVIHTCVSQDFVKQSEV